VFVRRVVPVWMAVATVVTAVLTRALPVAGQTRPCDEGADVGCCLSTLEVVASSSTCRGGHQTHDGLVTVNSSAAGGLRASTGVPLLRTVAFAAVTMFPGGQTTGLGTLMGEELDKRNSRVE
jgi:hypothetical protein